MMLSNNNKKNVLLLTIVWKAFHHFGEVWGGTFWDYAEEVPGTLLEDFGDLLRRFVGRCLGRV